jgi:hypothetical protein
MENKISRDEFMAFFRDNESLNTLSPDDRIEIFSTILLVEIPDILTPSYRRKLTPSFPE